MSIARMEVLKLYRALLKESSKFSDYNFRMYALRRIKSRFRENQSLTDSTEIESWYKDGIKNLEIIRRQVVIGNLYKAEKLVIENESSDTFISPIGVVKQGETTVRMKTIYL